MWQIRQVSLDTVEQTKEDLPNPWTRYIGKSDFGVTDSESKWMISRVTREGNIWTTTYALKGSRVAKWSDRASYFPAVGVSYCAYQQNMGADFNSDAIVIGGGSGVSLQLIWSGNDTGTGTVQLESSVDGVCWCDFPDGDFTIPLTAGCKPLELTNTTLPFFRVKYSKNSNTTGLLDVCYNVAGYGKPWAVK